MLNTYTGVEDLLCDDTFLSWYFKTDIRAIRQWERWMSENPGSNPRVWQAVEFLSSLGLEEKDPHPDVVSYAEQQLLNAIHRAHSRSLHTPRTWWLAAASLLVLAVAAYFFIPKQNTIAFHTSYGQITSGQLPDGSEVTVNADSKITWSGEWKEGKDREVWLSGEAFFHVRKMPSKSRFIVHTGHFDVIVTGTMFNVQNRQDRSNIMLQEGSVILQTSDGKELPMTPGDFVEYNHDHLVKRIAKQDSIVAWKEHKLYFDGTTIREVAAIIQEQYGVTTRPANEAVGNRTIFGILPNYNLDVLLKALEATSEFQIVHQGGEIIIQDHSN